MFDKSYEEFKDIVAIEPKANITGIKSSYTAKQGEEFTITFNNPGVSFTKMHLYSTAVGGAPRLTSIRVTSTSATFICNEVGSWEKYYLFEPGSAYISDYLTLTVLASGGGGEPPSGSNKPPEISVIRDLNITTTQTVQLVYSASDTDGTISKHEFSENNGSSYKEIYPSKSGSDYAYHVSYPTAGTRSCKVRVTDNKGATATTPTFYIRVTDNSSGGGGGSTDNAPYISTIRDIDTKVSQSFSVNYTATDDKGISKHEFSDNNGGSYSTIYPSSSGNSYSYSKTYSSSGTRSCKIRVTDTSGKTATTPTFYIRVSSNDSGGGGVVTDKPPTISSIGDIDTKVSQRFTIYYNANDDKGINTHEFSDNNGSSYSLIYPDGSSGSYSYSKTYSSTGTRSCKIRVTDTKGQTATSPTFYINVNSSDSGTKPPSTGVKAELYNAKIAFDDSHSNLKNVINSIIADGRFDEVSEKNRLDNAFASYRDALSYYSKIHQKALDNINDNAKKEAENNAIEQAESKIAVLDGRIDLKVSKGDVVNQINLSTEGARIEASKIQLEGAVTVANGGGDKVKINNADYEIINGSTTKAFFGLRELDDTRLIPRLAMGHAGLNKYNDSYLVMQTYPKDNNPQSYNYPYLDIGYRCNEYLNEENYGDVSNIKMYGDGAMRISPIQKLEITTNFKDGTYAGGAERLIAEFGSSASSYYERYMDIPTIRNTQTSNGLILAHRNASDQSCFVRVNCDTNGERFFRPLTADGNVSLGSGGFPWKSVHSKNAYSSEGIIANLKTKVVNNITIENVLDNIEFPNNNAKLLNYEDGILMDVTNLYGTKFIDTYENCVYIDNNEMIKLLLKEVKQLKEEVKLLRNT